jgi:hypothetical protein
MSMSMHMYMYSRLEMAEDLFHATNTQEQDIQVTPNRNITIEFLVKQFYDAQGQPPRAKGYHVWYRV